ncbi:hypothetical protein IQK56_02095 [Pseudomonas sp. MAFF 301449]|uniref:Uncharacterized protein n=1 Tax=Pseudomonas cyclaminis TaxID=2781239 RepID=A0ABR9SMH0_9PSED|nr:hypothetical protein [Pseudomonas cyclaminis]MBE8589809.1 hypothetical protein [Pseudomonas cyclaminis]MBE8598809.1 hypothetical protein [Pseudomonas cyclaminis]
MDNRGSTLARLKILTKALQDNKSAPASLSKACYSQGSFASYIYPSEGIGSMALNTLKSSANQFIEDGGWRKLDSLRKAYLTIYKTGSHGIITKHRNKENQKQQLIELQNALDLERRYRIRVQIAYESLLQRMHILVKTEPELASFINQHLAVFSLKRITLANDNEQQS